MRNAQVNRIILQQSVATRLGAYLLGRILLTCPDGTQSQTGPHTPEDAKPAVPIWPKPSEPPPILQPRPCRTPRVCRNPPLKFPPPPETAPPDFRQTATGTGRSVTTTASADAPPELCKPPPQSGGPAPAAERPTRKGYQLPDQIEQPIQRAAHRLRDQCRDSLAELEAVQLARGSLYSV